MPSPALNQILFADPYAAWDTVLDFPAGYYKLGGARCASFLGIPGATYTRSGAAYASTASGLLVPFAANAPRITDLGMLVEESRTNLLLRSQDLSTTWSQTGVTPTYTQPALDGTTTSALLTETGATSTHRVLQGSLTFATTTAYEYSFYLKNNGARYVDLLVFDGSKAYVAGFDLQAGVTNGVGQVAGAAVPTSSIQAMANGYYRCAIAIVSSSGAGSGGNVQVQLNRLNASLALATDASYAGDGTSGAYLWQGDLQAGAFLTSPIPTTSAAVTRGADSAVLAIANTTAGTLFAEWTGPAQSGSAGGKIVGSDGANDTALLRLPVSALTSINTTNSTPTTLTKATTFTAALKARGAVAWDASGRSVTAAGLAAATDANVIGTWSNLYLGQDDGLAATGALNSYLQRVLIKSARASGGDIQGLTAP